MQDDQDDPPNPMTRIITRLNTSELPMETILPPDAPTLTLGFGDAFRATVVVTSSIAQVPGGLPAAPVGRCSAGEWLSGNDCI